LGIPSWLRLVRRVAGHASRTRHGLRADAAFGLVAGSQGDGSRGCGRTFAATAVACRQASPVPPGRVIVWPDTFTNHLAPEVGHAALRVLAAAGFEAVVPRTPICCGLTAITTGQLDRAREELRRSLAAPELAGDEPVLVLEPSCATTLRLDLCELLRQRQRWPVA
jgi:Fe-S oxidoreductase